MLTCQGKNTNLFLIFLEIFYEVYLHKNNKFINFLQKKFEKKQFLN